MDMSLSAITTECGITRLATMTGLDRIGFPVVAAVRPLSRNLSVSMGKGQTLQLAQIAAVMEAAELFYSERPPVELVSASFHQLGAEQAIDPIVFAADATNNELQHMPLLWIRGHILASGQPVLVPWQAVSMDFSLEEQDRRCRFAGGSTGLAAAFELKAAQLHGLLEVIERDCHHRWNSLDDEARLKTLVDPAIGASPRLLQMLDQVAAAGLHLFVWDMTSQMEVPCYMAEVLDFAEGAATPFAQGCAAHPQTTIAIEKALAEALQVRLTYISGSRDDLDWSDYGDRFKAVVGSRQWLAGLQLKCHAPGSTPAGYMGSPDKTVQKLGERLRDVKHADVITVALAPADAPVSAVKVIVPALRDTPDANYFARGRQRHHDD